jgi:hypothetical protein
MTKNKPFIITNKNIRKVLNKVDKALKANGCERIGIIPNQKSTPDNWEKDIVRIAKNYANKVYLVSEESYPEKEEIDSLKELIDAISTLLLSQKKEMIEKIEDALCVSYSYTDKKNKPFIEYGVGVVFKSIGKAIKNL